MTRVLFLISDTGGGHRAGANAVAAGLRDLDPSADVRIEDALVRTAPFPVNRAPAVYTWGMKHARPLWGSTFHIMNGPRRARLMASVGWPGMRRRLAALIAEADPDVIVSTHPLVTRIVVRAVAATGRVIPFVIVVTDLVTGHASWYEPDADLICLPTHEALERAASCGVPREKLLLTGQPLHPRAASATGPPD